MANITALISGLVFGLGLILSEMINPDRVLSFLDIMGSWDPYLAWVMVGAIAMSSVAFAVASKRKQSYLGLAINLPTAKTIDKELVLGSFVFGVGWGIAGLCPGPALVLAGTGSFEGIMFVVSMLLGMGLFEISKRFR